MRKTNQSVQAKATRARVAKRQQKKGLEDVRADSGSATREKPKVATATQRPITAEQLCEFSNLRSQAQQLEKRLQEMRLDLLARVEAGAVFDHRAMKYVFWT